MIYVSKGGKRIKDNEFVMQFATARELKEPSSNKCGSIFRLETRVRYRRLRKK